ncbi:MAG: hypothetical protein ACLVC2_07585 [Emergencia timonensis]
MITEIVTMKTIEDISREEFLAIVDGLEKNFHSKQDGFVDTELLEDKKKRSVADDTALGFCRAVKIRFTEDVFR